MGKSRLEAFSDGVLAVAITLLVLDLHFEKGETSLASQLHDQWPSFAAYALSFFVIGVIWVNHHALFALVDRVDRKLMFYNLLLLMWVTTIPFTTSTLAKFLQSGGADSRLAVLLYGASMEGMSIGFVLILGHMLKAKLLIRPVDAPTGRRALLRFGIGNAVYPLVVLIGLASPIAMLVLYGVLTLYYIVEQTPILPADEPATPVEF
jgi:uncharacterized membrane protein